MKIKISDDQILANTVNDAIIMGGMTKHEIRDFLKLIGWLE